MKIEVSSININSVIVEGRHRRDLGDIQSLADSIRKIGLLHPIVICKGKLVAGERRLAAFKLLAEEKGNGHKYIYIPAHYAENFEQAAQLLKAEHDENICRKDFAPSEAYAIGQLLEPIERAEAEERRSTLNNAETAEGNFPQAKKGKTADKVGAAVGMSGKTYSKVKDVMLYAAEMNMPELVTLMDEQSVDAASKQISRIKIQANHAEKRARPIPDGKYQVIYADPPWQYENSGFNESAESQYPTMPVEDICNLPIGGMAENTSVLFLWATNPLLLKALKVMKSWGFEYKTNIAWVKDRGRGKGWFLKSKHELLLIGVRSETPQPAERPDSAQEFERGHVHSRKPQEFYELIERMYPEGKKIELFSRLERDGWTGWGNEW